MSTTSNQSLSSALTVISANIEGLSGVKASMLSDLCKEQHGHCLCLKETQRCKKREAQIPGMTLVAERPHYKYGSAIFIRDDLKVKSISVTATNHVEVTTRCSRRFCLYISHPASSLYSLHWDTEAYPRL